MGTASRRERHSPQRLAEKLLQVRLALSLSQNGILRRMGWPEKLSQSNISGYERGVREPPLLILLQYARLAGIDMEVLVDDNLDLPEVLPVRPRDKVIKRKLASKAISKGISKNL